MRLNIPLIPFQIDVRWRPLRVFRFSVRGLMLVVGILGLFFSLLAYERRLALANNYHASQAQVSSVNQLWHKAMWDQYHAAIQRTEIILTILALIILTLVVVTVTGRVLNWLRQRLDVPPRE